MIKKLQTAVIAFSVMLASHAADAAPETIVPSDQTTEAWVNYVDAGSVYFYSRNRSSAHTVLMKLDVTSRQSIQLASFPDDGRYLWIQQPLQRSGNRLFAYATPTPFFVDMGGNSEPEPAPFTLMIVYPSHEHQVDDTALYSRTTDHIDRGFWRSTFYKTTLDDGVTTEILRTLDSRSHSWDNPYNDYVVDQDYIYWSKIADPTGAPRVEVWRMHKAGSTPSMVLYHHDLPDQTKFYSAWGKIAVDDGYIYWNSWSEGIKRAAVTGNQTPQVLSQIKKCTDAPVFHGSDVFFWGLDKGIYQVSKTGGTAVQVVAPTDVGPGEHIPRNLMAGPQGIFWNSDDGIKFLALP